MAFTIYQNRFQIKTNFSKLTKFINLKTFAFHFDTKIKILNRNEQTYQLNDIKNNKIMEIAK